MALHPKYLNNLPEVSPMETGKKKDEGEENETDMTMRQAKEASAKLILNKTEMARKSLEEALRKKGSQ